MHVLEDRLSENRAYHGLLQRAHDLSRRKDQGTMTPNSNQNGQKTRTTPELQSTHLNKCEY